MNKAILGLLAGISLFFLLPGCVQEQQSGGTGNLVLLISDAEADIADFNSVNVVFSKARIFLTDSNSGFEEISLAGTSVDLTKVIGEKAVPIADIELAAGTYTKIELFVESIEATLLDGNTAVVTVPSDKLKIIKPFTVDANTETKFVFDIEVVRKGSTNEYNLLPVIGKSGVVGEDLSEGEVEEVSEGKAKKEREQEQEGEE